MFFHHLLGGRGFAVPSPFHIPLTIVVPLVCPLPVGCPVLRAASSDYFRLGAENDFHAIMSPSKQGLLPSPCSV